MNQTSSCSQWNRAVTQSLLRSATYQTVVKAPLRQHLILVVPVRSRRRHRKIGQIASGTDARRERVLTTCHARLCCSQTAHRQCAMAAQQMTWTCASMFSHVASLHCECVTITHTCDRQVLDFVNRKRWLMWCVRFSGIVHCKNDLTALLNAAQLVQGIPTDCVVLLLLSIQYMFVSTFCYRAILSELREHSDAWPFLTPVNTKQFPTYRKVIRCPVDFQTIGRKLKTNT